MTIHHRPYLFLFLILILVLIVTNAISVAGETSPPPRPQPSAASPDAGVDQMAHILDALIGTGDFGSWAGVISSAVLPLSSTIFIPENDSSSASGDPFMLPYHVIPQRLTFPELLQFRTRARLPTLLPGKMLVVTNNSRLNYTIDGSQITMPDLYSTATFTIHGVKAAFDYSVYRDGLVEVVPSPGAVSKPLPENQSELTRSPNRGASSSASTCICNELQAVVLAVFVVLGFNIHWPGFGSKAKCAKKF